MKRIITTLALTTMICACNTNPLLKESNLDYQAPLFDQIKDSDYLPALKKGIEEAKADIDAIIDNPEAPSFGNTIEAMERSGKTLNRVSGLFYNILESTTSDTLQETAEAIAPLMNEYEMYVSLNSALFDRVKAVYDKKEQLGLEKDQLKLLENTYKGFVRGGALLNEDDKATYSELCEKLSLATLRFSKNALGATNAFTLNITDMEELAGIPDFVLDQAAEIAQKRGDQGWTFDLSYPIYSGVMKYADNRELRRKLHYAYGTRAMGGDFDNQPTVLEITDLRIKIARILGYETYADYVLEERMIKTPAQVNYFLEELLAPSLPAARKDVKAVTDYAHSHGYRESRLQAWDFSYWSEKYQKEKYDISEAELKPYFELDSCVVAVFGLAHRLYGLNFETRPDLPVYHKDVKTYDITDADGRHMALIYLDFFPRESKRSGAWMTEFRGQSIENGVEYRPQINLVTNFTKATANAPALITHDELCTLLHEFGHCLHGILSEGRYSSLSTTNVSTDFVEMPSQIMENWAYQPEFLAGFAKHYKTGEPLPMELIDKIIAAKNYNAAYYQVRQLNFGLIDMSWNNLSEMTEDDVLTHEAKVLKRTELFPPVDGTAISTAFTHIFTGQYAAGYYSYKWSEVLEADAFSLFEEKGIFNPEVADSFRRNILSKGGTDDYAKMFRDFRGHDPEVSALLHKLGITK